MNESLILIISTQKNAKKKSFQSFQNQNNLRLINLVAINMFRVYFSFGV
jgi:uncharacterized membrane protein (DUF485 family)